MDFTKVGKIENIFFRGRPIHTLQLAMYSTPALPNQQCGNSNMETATSKGVTRPACEKSNEEPLAIR